MSSRERYQLVWWCSHTHIHTRQFAFSSKPAWSDKPSHPWYGGKQRASPAPLAVSLYRIYVCMYVCITTGSSREVVGPRQGRGHGMLLKPREVEVLCSGGCFQIWERESQVLPTPMEPGRVSHCCIAAILHMWPTISACCNL